MTLRKLATAFVSLYCLEASFAAEILFNPGLGAKAHLQVLHTAQQSDQPAPLQIHVEVGGIHVDPGSDGFQSITVPGLEPTADFGKPDLPGSGVLLALPPGLNVELVVDQHKKERLDRVPVQPCQPKTRCSLKKALPFHFKSELYRSGETFPQSVAAIEELGTLRGVRLVRVALNPLQAQLHDSSLMVTTDMTVEVRFSGTPQPMEVPHAIRQMLLQSVENRDAVAQWVHTKSGPETMVIVTADNLESSLAPFVDWKRQRGLNVVVQTYSGAGSSVLNVKKYLKDFYAAADPKPSYVLFVGNNQTLPGYPVATGMGLSISDYGYTLLDGSDYIPDVLQGRLVADTTDEVATQLERWMAYEKGQSKQTWYSNAMTIASEEGFSPSDEDYADQISKALKSHTFFSVDLFFERNKTATHDNILRALNAGRSWAAYFGHGTGFYWTSTNKFFGISDIDRVDNAGRLPILIDVACRNGAWGDKDIPLCFGKAWVTRKRDGKPVGAVAYYGGTVNVSWNEPATMSVGIAKYHFERPVHSLGGSLLAGQMYMLEKMGISSFTIDNLKWFELFGDPSMILRTQTPKAYSVSHRRGRARELKIEIADEKGSPLKDVHASVHVPRSLGPLAQGTTDNTGKVSLRLPEGSSLDGTLLTTYGYNLETLQETL